MLVLSLIHIYAAITWHPSTLNVVSSGSHQSCIQCYFRFHGVSSHAAGNPEAGRSALDAAELMSVGVNYLREHMDSKERVHYAYTNAGGISPNVVQAEAEVKYLVRSTTNPKCQKLYERVINIAKGAALMTGTTCDVIFDEGLSNVIPNFTLEQVLEEAFLETGAPEYTEAERAYAKQFRDTYPLDPESEVTASIAEPKTLIANIQNSDICDIVLRHRCVDECSMGSTDVGDVSWVVPTAQINTACYSYGAGGHLSLIHIWIKSCCWAIFSITGRAIRCRRATIPRKSLRCSIRWPIKSLPSAATATLK